MCSAGSMVVYPEDFALLSGVTPWRMGLCACVPPSPSSTLMSASAIADWLLQGVYKPTSTSASFRKGDCKPETFLIKVVYRAGRC